MNETKVFRDPIYGYVKIRDELIWKLVQTKEFQRLRRIHQLGGTSMVFHTAEHSRFSHSLGVYEIARRIVYEVESVSNTLTDEERLITLCAALLHDLGHGPYSHTFESVFATNHEQFTIAIITGDTEVHAVLESYQPGFSNKVARTINGECYQGECHDAACHHHIMGHIISSQLDADRLDYLQRDAYNTGATYGEVDQDRILRSMVVVDNQLAFKYSSMHAIENYLVSRYHMYWQVYYHPVSVSHEILLSKIFHRVMDLMDQGYPFPHDLTAIRMLKEGAIDLETYLELDEVWVNYHVKEWTKASDPILSDLSERFINRRLYKYLSCRSENELQEAYEIFSQVYQKYGIDPNYYLQQDTISKEAYQFYNEHVLHHSPILLYYDQRLVEIAELSHIVRGIKDVGAKTDYKLYYAKEWIETMEITDKERLQDLIERYQ